MKYKCENEDCKTEFEVQEGDILDCPVCGGSQVSIIADNQEEIKDQEPDNSISKEDTETENQAFDFTEHKELSDEESDQTSLNQRDNDKQQETHFESENQQQDTKPSAKNEIDDFKNKSEPMVDEEWVIKYYSRGSKIISVIGFADSGKSFFINRLRQDLSEKYDWTCRPSAAEKIVSTASKIEETVFQSLNTNNRQYIFLDCDGTEFRSSFSKHSDDPRKAGPIKLNTRYLSVLAFASAYIFIIPAELFNESSTDENINNGRDNLRNLINNFYDFVNTIILLSDKVGKVEKKTDSLNKDALKSAFKELLNSGITFKEVHETSTKKGNRCSRPICVLLSKSDEYHKSTNDEEFDRDPFMFASEKLRRLYNVITHKFINYRFDFLASFWGHDGGITPDYDSNSYGAIQAFSWISSLIERNNFVWNLPKRIWFGQVSTVWPVTIRRLLDDKFRYNTKTKDRGENRGQN